MKDTLDTSKNTLTQNDSSKYFNIHETIGVVVFNNSGDYIHRESIKIFDEDGSIFAIISFLDNELIVGNNGYNLYGLTTQVLKSMEIGFNPKEFYPEMGAVIQFLCVGVSKEGYEILVDDGVKKIIHVEPDLFEFQSWEEHLLTCFVSFDSNTNPIRDRPNTNSRILYKGNDYAFNVVELKGDWAKVRCDLICLPCDKEKLVEGWLRWRNGKYIILELSYIC